MKTSTLLFCLFVMALLFVAGLNWKKYEVEPTVAPTVKNITEVEVNYNVKTDEFVNKLITTKPISKVIDTINFAHYIAYTFKWEECKIKVIHYLQTPYLQKESWDYFAHHEDGRMLMISSSLGINKHMLDSDTYIKLQNLCK